MIEVASLLLLSVAVGLLSETRYLLRLSTAWFRVVFSRESSKPRDRQEDEQDT